MVIELDHVGPAARLQGRLAATQTQQAAVQLENPGVRRERLLVPFPAARFEGRNRLRVRTASARLLVSPCLATGEVASAAVGERPAELLVVIREKEERAARGARLTHEQQRGLGGDQQQRRERAKQRRI